MTVYAVLATGAVGVPDIVNVAPLYRRVIESAPTILTSLLIILADNPAGSAGLTEIVYPLNVPAAVYEVAEAVPPDTDNGLKLTNALTAPV